MLPRFPAVLLVLALAGCMHLRDVTTGRTENESRSIDLGKAELVNAEIHFGAGRLEISGGAVKLMDADFEYNIPSLKPEVRYEETSFRGRLSLHQPTVAKLGGDGDNRWNVRLNNDVPFDLSVHIGAGEARLDLSQLSMRRLDTNIGAGRVELNLTGDYKKNFDVQVRGGVGEATLRLPRNVGVIAHARGGIGDINVRGMKRDGDRWVNDAYQKSKVTLTVDVSGGVGQINLISE